MSRIKSIMIGGAIAGLTGVSGLALAADNAQGSYGNESGTYNQSSTMQTSEQNMTGPEKDVHQAVNTLQTLRQQAPDLAAKVPDAKGVFIIPDYATAALLIGGSGGEGVLMTQHDGQWGNPAFYDVGNVNFGASAGAAAGPVVLLLMNDKAVQNFRNGTNFNLNAESGLTVVNWNAKGAASSNGGDVIAWSNTKGLMAQASVGVGGISYDQSETQKYYNQNQQVSAQDVLDGNVQNPHSNVLKTEFAQFTGQSVTGENGTMQQATSGTGTMSQDEDNDIDNQ